MTLQHIRVLLVEDNSGDARLLRETLIYEDPTQYTLTHVQRLKEALEFLHDEAYDVVLLDLGLPDSHGLDTLITTREQAPGIPIVILTGFEDEDNAIKAVQEGAQDYLIKGQVDGGVLKRSLRYAIERKRAEEAVREREMEAVELAHVQESRRRIIVAQEQLRKEIAQELHGPVQTLLLVAQQRIQGITKTLSTPAGDLEKELAEVAKLLEDVRDNQVRRISHRLHPSIISLGLLPSLRSLRDHMGRAIPIELEVGPEVSEMEENGASSIPEEVRLGLYRVAEEAIANALKHSEASKVVVRLGVGADTETLQLSIEDNGRGFDPETTPRGLGLTTMDDYLAAIGGTYTLETAPGQGTRATATIQLNHRSDNGSRASLAID